MAITVTSKYKPFTYDELVKPLEGYWKEYDQQENALAKLKTDASALKNYLESLPKVQGADGQMVYSAEDQKLVNQYNNYLSAIDNLSTEIASSGLTQNAKRYIKDLPIIYNDQIAPIATAIEKRGKWADAIKQQEAAGNWVDLNPDLVGLDPFMAGNTPEYHIANRTELGNIMEATAKQVTNALEPEKNGDFWEYGIPSGLYLAGQLPADKAAIMQQLEQTNLQLVLDRLNLSYEEFTQLPSQKQNDIYNFIRQKNAEGAVYNRVKASSPHSSEETIQKKAIFQPNAYILTGKDPTKAFGDFTTRYEDYTTQAMQYKAQVEQIFKDNPKLAKNYEILDSYDLQGEVAPKTQYFSVKNGMVKLPVVVKLKDSENNDPISLEGYYVWVPQGKVTNNLYISDFEDPDNFLSDDDKTTQAQNTLQNLGLIIG